MDRFVDAFTRAAAQVVDAAPELLAALATLALFVVIGRIAAHALAKALVRTDGHARSVRALRRVTRLAFAAVGLVLGLQILGLTAVATSLLATGGLVAIVLGFAFREIGENLLAGAFLGVSRSFDVGDLIETSGQLGEVREIELRQVWLRAADGRDIFVPSAQIFRNVLVNFTRDGLRRGDFVVGIDYADRVMDARALLLDATRSVPEVLSDPPPSVRLSEFKPQYCELRVLFWVDLTGEVGLADVRSNVMGACLRALREKGYTLSSDVSTAVTLTQASGGTQVPSS